MPANLTHAHKATYDAILRNPAPHNLKWHDVRSMLEAMAQVEDHASGSVKVIHNGQLVILHPDGNKDISDADLKSLRAFLERNNESVAPTAAPGANLLVVVDHREARVYSTELHGSVPVRIVPHQAGESQRYLHHVEEGGDGQRRPEVKSFYDDIAKSLQGAQSVLIFGGGTGASSAMEQLTAQLKSHHKEVAAKIVGSVVVDEHHQTEDQLLAQARKFYAARPRTQPTPPASQPITT